MFKTTLKYIITLSLIAFVFQCKPTTIKISESDTGTKLEMKKGDSLEIVLKANPTTGYRWEVASIDTSILKNTGIEYQADKVPSGVVGSGGKTTMRFIAIKEGETFLQLIYRRPFEKDVPPVKKFELNIVVKR
ncbi:MAG TPA: protease inhibitor I42 family protein [Candidatus Marinimicrobia bacterium]|nr:protease inhibitor I42 family protein [Candidatus Neomarinimicrobiota bacterium]HRS51570.1 protease inhibitor I42 family protein [Candidatus Neomarinimicrobiota bacterium]HRU92352.1 protease inhibitor I42 family protein [Candidatus Neomarinimicrobiota bacterium]